MPHAPWLVSSLSACPAPVFLSPLQTRKAPGCPEAPRPQLSHSPLSRPVRLCALDRGLPVRQQAFHSCSTTARVIPILHLRKPGAEEFIPDKEDRAGEQSHGGQRPNSCSYSYQGCERRAVLGVCTHAMPSPTAAG